MMSIVDLLGVPETVQTTLLLLALALTLAPFLSGVKIGGVEIPKLDPRRRRGLRIAGPASVVVAIAFVVPVPALRPSPANLRLLAADAMENGDIDVAVANSGTSPALLTAIELEVGRESAVTARPVLQTSATYRVAIGELSAGQRRRLIIRHLVPAGVTERFSIHPETTRAATIHLSLFAADGAVMRTLVDLNGGGRR